MNIRSPTIVADLWNKYKKWGVQKISNIFDDQATQSILHVQIVQQDDEDRLYWRHTPSGQWSKSAYKQVYKKLHPNQSNVCHSAQAMIVTYAQEATLEETGKPRTLEFKPVAIKISAINNCQMDSSKGK
uniref:Uncharacterized protein n=1 Tax=Oryza punctata TaxID=4537 RepID=A0A0E0L7G2_ORYPU